MGIKCYNRLCKDDLFQKGVNMKVELNTKTENIKSGTLVKFNDKGLVPCYYGIYLTDIDGENPILYVL